MILNTLKSNLKTIVINLRIHFSIYNLKSGDVVVKKIILLIRHIESLKNTLNACSSLDGKEPITKHGYYQAEAIAKYISEKLGLCAHSSATIYCARDDRSQNTAIKIARKLQVAYTISDELASFTNNEISGKINSDILNENSEFEKKLKLYRAGLISANMVPWPAGDTELFQKLLESFFVNVGLYYNPCTIIIGHKSSLTCLAFIIMRYLNQYPDNFYGYVDIPPGNGILIEFDDDYFNMELLDFDIQKKKTSVDVVIKNGKIVFPGSACAVCWKNEKLLLVQQNRYGHYSWELPGGKIESKETPISAASRELFEESGYSGLNGKLLYNIDLDLSISQNKTYIVEFEKFEKTGKGEYLINWFGLEELKNMIEQSKITHVQTIIAYLSKKG